MFACIVVYSYSLFCERAIMRVILIFSKRKVYSYGLKRLLMILIFSKRKVR
jgi:hypothetical protein